MDEQFCRGCSERPDCKKVYQQLGNATGQSVTLTVIAAFLAPVAVFVASLALMQRILAGIVVIGPAARTAFCFAVAAATTLVAVFSIRVLNTHVFRAKGRPNSVRRFGTKLQDGS